jgi:hypothetical protein
VLNGVGGRSVWEAKRNVSQAEFVDWCEYRERFGSLNLGMRLEAGFALVSLLMNRSLGGQANIEDFMPHLEQQEATPEDIMKLLTGSKK